MNLFFRIKMFLRYAVKAKTKYYLHSPFVYQFYLNVIENAGKSNLNQIRARRAELESDPALLTINDFGTGTQKQKSLAQIAANVSVSHKYGQLLYSLVQNSQPATILELGTSIGLSSSYMALANPSAQLITIEGAEQIAHVARQTHRKLNVSNARVVVGPFETALPEVLKQREYLDFVFFDGNHTHAATLNYFEQCLAKAGDRSVFVFDDIYWSPGMAAAWQQIKLHPQITLTLDVYRFGICFFQKDKLAKEDFVLWY
jgi:predicted O-methyltransferase YrrM